MKKTLSIILAVIMIMTMAVSFTSCGSKDTFILGLDNSFPPMGFVDENGETVGFDIDVAKEACDRLGLELEIMPIDWDAKHLVILIVSGMDLLLVRNVWKNAHYLNRI